MNIDVNEYLYKELNQYINILGHFPTRSFLKEKGRDDLIQMIRNSGGVEHVAAALKVPTYNEFNTIHDSGYWNNERIIEEYAALVSKHSLKQWPSPGDLQGLGYGAIAAAISIYAGGHIAFRKNVILSGIELLKKPRSLEHLIPYKNIYHINDSVFKNSELKYYFLGLVAADGNIVSSKYENAVELCLNYHDIEILEKLRDLISPDRPIRDKPSKVKEEYLAKRLKFNSKPMVEMIANYMTLDNKSRNLIWPDNIPDEYLKHFIRGYFDGDGTIDVTSNRKECKDGLRYYHIPRIRFLGTEDFLTGLTKAIEKLITIPAVKVHKKGNENVYCLTYTGINAKLLHTYMYGEASIYLKRKAALWKFILNTPADELARIYKTEEGRLNKRAKERTL